MFIRRDPIQNVTNKLKCPPDKASLIFSTRNKLHQFTVISQYAIYPKDMITKQNKTKQNKQKQKQTTTTTTTTNSHT